MSLLTDFYANTRSPSQREITWLTESGVPNPALGQDPGFDGCALGAARVTFEGRYFDFSEDEDATTALVFVARNSLGDDADMVAWSPRDGSVGALFGIVSMLGENRALTPRLGEPLLVHRNPLGWLRAGRRGCVILDPDGARSLLQCAGTLQAEDIEHGLALRAALQPPEVPILVPNESSNAAVAA